MLLYRSEVLVTIIPILRVYFVCILLLCQYNNYVSLMEEISSLYCVVSHWLFWFNSMRAMNIASLIFLISMCAYILYDKMITLWKFFMQYDKKRGMQLPISRICSFSMCSDSTFFWQMAFLAFKYNRHTQACHLQVIAVGTIFFCSLIIYNYSVAFALFWASLYLPVFICQNAIAC